MIRAFGSLAALLAVAALAVGTGRDPSITQLAVAGAAGVALLIFSGLLDLPGRFVVDGPRLRHELLVGAGLAAAAAVAVTAPAGIAMIALGLVAVTGLVAVVASVGTNRR